MNKDYAQKGLKLGLGSGRKAPSTKRGEAGPTSLPMNSPNWPGVPGATQPRSRAGGTPTSGPMGQFQVKKVGL